MSDASVRAPAIGVEGFRAGRVLSRSLGILFRNLPKYLPFGAVMAVPVTIEIFNKFGVEAEHASRIGSVTAYFLTLVVTALCQSTMIHGAFQNVQGQNFDLGVSIGRGLRRFLPVLGASICYALAVGLATALFIVPGLIVLTMYFVAVPICVVEGLGPIRSLDRSAKLTKGNRWRIFAIALVTQLMLVVGISLFAGIGGFLAIMTGATDAIGVTVAVFAGSAIVNPYLAMVAIMTYHDLRAVKEGLDIEQLAAVFD